MEIIERPGYEPLELLIPRFLSNAEAHLMAEDINGWVIQISHHLDTETQEPVSGDLVSVTFSVDVKEEMELDIDGDFLNNGLILQSHITDMENIMQCLKLNPEVKGWEIAVFTGDE